MNFVCHRGLNVSTDAVMDPQLEALAEELQKRQKTAGAPAAPSTGSATKPDVLAVQESGCGVLNASNKAKDFLKAVLTVPEGEVEAVRSDCDAQLLLNITLAQPSKISSIRVAAPEAASAPSTIKLYVNKLGLSFDDVEDLAPTQELTLQGAAGELKLNFVKFQNVSSLTVFIEGNQGDEEATMLSRFHLVGVPIHTTNMNDLKKGG